MDNFVLRLRLESPLLLGGPESGAVDSSHMLSGLAVRGLFRTFARALIGPFLDQDLQTILNAENKLLGSAGSEHGGHATYRVQDTSITTLEGPEKFLNRPGGGKKGDRQGYREDGSNGKPQGRAITIRPRPHALYKVKLLPQMLCAVAWSAFAFGSMGARARRGYGSLATERIDNAPQFAIVAETRANALPVFSPDDSPEDLGRKLNSGLDLSHQTTRKWLAANGFLPGPAAQPPAVLFQLFGPDYVFVGQPFPDSDTLMIHLMAAASKAKDDYPGSFTSFIGSENPRLASTIWVRMFRTSEGRVGVATLSPFHSNDANAESIVDSLLGAIGAAGTGSRGALSEIVR